MLYTTFIVSTLLAAVSAVYECPLMHPMISISGCLYGQRCVKPTRGDGNYVCQAIGSPYSSGQYIGNELNPQGKPDVSYR